MSTEDIARDYLLYFILPLWLATGFGDWLGLVIEKYDEGTATFNVVVMPPSIFSDDFDGGDTLEWSSVTP